MADLSAITVKNTNPNVGEEETFVVLDASEIRRRSSLVATILRKFWNHYTIRIFEGVGACPSCSADSIEQQEKQRSSSYVEAINKKKRKREEKKKKTAPSSWGYSTELMMYDDQWKLKKVLNGSDVGNMSRMLLPKNMAEKLMVEVVGYNNHNDKEGVKVDICDMDTHSMHTFVFKRWGSSRSYVFIGTRSEILF
ncbi:hypothetical protein PIB30_021470 [Stylosanthes scabra]|uniref:Uncharacterized protein n=1 Tax=Stylosanthes scabra TaxID=79078 RepID=A0ABU6X690_9FABA|nr:hypothetical protein [Stylosanthes scabra]